MSENMEDLIHKIGEESERRADTMQRLLSAADSSRVFGSPVVSGDSVVITAAEVATGGGFGSGMGFGMPQGPKARQKAESNEEERQPGPGAGGGGGGGGGSVGRPVAVITISPEGIRVKPILDLTKITLTAVATFTTLAVLALKTLRRT